MLARANSNENQPKNLADTPSSAVESLAFLATRAISAPMAQLQRFGKILNCFGPVVPKWAGPNEYHPLSGEVSSPLLLEPLIPATLPPFLAELYPLEVTGLVWKRHSHIFGDQRFVCCSCPPTVIQD